jgi:hypothetical protein
LSRVNYNDAPSAVFAMSLLQAVRVSRFARLQRGGARARAAALPSSLLLASSHRRRLLAPPNTALRLQRHRARRAHMLSRRAL